MNEKTLGQEGIVGDKKEKSKKVMKYFLPIIMGIIWASLHAIILYIKGGSDIIMVWIGMTIDFSLILTLYSILNRYIERIWH